MKTTTTQSYREVIMTQRGDVTIITAVVIVIKFQASCYLPQGANFSSIPPESLQV